MDGEMEQRMLDHEMRLSRTAELVLRYRAARRARLAARAAWEQDTWMRREISEMIAAARRDELDHLGLTDDVVRELRLGDSVLEAWEKLHPAPFNFAPPPRKPGEPAG